MADEAKNSAATQVAEIGALKRQIEEMQKRLEELSAATGVVASGEETLVDSAASVDGTESGVKTQGVADENAAASEGAAEEEAAAEEGSNESESAAEIAAEAIADEPSGKGSPADGAFVVKPSGDESPVAEIAADADAACDAPAVEPVPAPAEPAQASSFEAASAQASTTPGAFPNTSSIEKVVDDDGKPVDPAYVAAAVADFMPTSQPPKPAPPIFNGVPYGQQGAAPQQPVGQPQQAAGQPQQPYAQPSYAAQQPYAQQPGQAAYYSQNNGYYAPGQGAYQVPYQQPLVRTKDHVAAGLLAIFLGVFGVHKFYLGYHTTGFIMLGVTILGSLLTIGIAAGVVWLIGVIEGIIYLTKNQSEFEQLYVFNKREMF